MDKERKRYNLSQSLKKTIYTGKKRKIYIRMKIRYLKKKMSKILTK